MTHMSHPTHAVSDRDWIAATEADLEPLLQRGSFVLAEQRLMNALRGADALLGHPPPLTSTFWMIKGYLPGPAGEDRDADRLRAGFDAFRAINIYAFQTIHSQSLFLHELEVQHLTPARATTPI